MNGTQDAGIERSLNRSANIVKGIWTLGGAILLIAATLITGTLYLNEKLQALNKALTDISTIKTKITRLEGIIPTGNPVFSTEANDDIITGVGSNTAPVQGFIPWNPAVCRQGYVMTGILPMGHPAEFNAGWPSRISITCGKVTVSR